MPSLLSFLLKMLVQTVIFVYFLYLILELLMLFSLLHRWLDDQHHELQVQLFFLLEQERIDNSWRRCCQQEQLPQVPSVAAYRDSLVRKASVIGSQQQA